MSQRIISQRNKASFADWTVLIQRVQGIGNAAAARSSASVHTVNGTLLQGGFTHPQARLPTEAAAPPPVGFQSDNTGASAIRP
ncbi:hypothetical protein D3C85_1623910 [compost metagenome]